VLGRVDAALAGALREEGYVLLERGALRDAELVVMDALAELPPPQAKRLMGTVAYERFAATLKKSKGENDGSE
jgi:hypothetical protein